MTLVALLAKHRVYHHEGVRAAAGGVESAAACIFTPGVKFLLTWPGDM